MHIKPELPFTLQTDASDVAISGIFYQDRKIVGIYSNKIRGSERNYTSMEKEFLAIYKALQHFRPLILGRKIDVLTDNKNLTFHTNSNKRLQRWKIRPCDFNLTFSHVEGIKIGATDYLSRMGHCNTTIDKKSRDEIQKNSWRTLTSRSIQIIQDNEKNRQNSWITKTVQRNHQIM